MLILYFNNNREYEINDSLIYSLKKVSLILLIFFLVSYKISTIFSGATRHVLWHRGTKCDFKCDWLWV